MNQENEDAKMIAADCIRLSQEGNYERGLFRRAGKLIQQLLAELEAVGAEASMFKTRCEQLQDAMEEELSRQDDATPQQPVPATPQKPELRVGQVWRTRGGGVAEIVDETKKPSHPFWCVSGDDQWTVTEDGMYWNIDASFSQDLIELISDVRKGGVA